MLTIDDLKAAVSYDPETGIFTRITNSKWNQRSNGKEIHTTDCVGYVVFKIAKKMYKAHRLAWMYVHGYMPVEQIDHINRVRNDNRISNLRLASQKQNNENKSLGRNNTSGVTGVTFQKNHGKWRAFIGHNNREIYLGEYDSFDEAFLVRKDAEAALYTHATTPPESL